MRRGLPRRRALRALVVLAATAAAAATPLGGLAPAFAQDPRAALAQDAARDWLAIVDRGDYASSWQAAGARFRRALDAARWKVALSRVRDPLGAVARRTVFRTGFPRAVKGAPDGDFAVVEFRTTFANRADALELVTLERDTAGRWQVVGYRIE